MDRQLNRIVESTSAVASSVRQADNIMHSESARNRHERGAIERGAIERGATERGAINYLSQGKSYLDKITEKLEKLDKVPSFYKIMFLIFFYIFFYKIFYDIGIFFGLNNLELIIYMTWFGMILFFASFISAKRSRLK
jgi:hypothetical protein